MIFLAQVSRAQGQPKMQIKHGPAKRAANRLALLLMIDDSQGGPDARRNHGEDDADSEERGSVHADDVEAGG